MGEWGNWNRFLDIHMCKEDDKGLRPCDTGSGCTRCDNDEVVDHYIKWLIDKKTK